MNKATKTLGILSLTASALVSGHVLAAPTGDTPLTLTGCVVAGEGKDSFLITNITVDGAAPPNAFYRFNSTEDVKRQVGRRVEITGTAHLGDQDKGTLATKTGANGKTTTEVTSERKTVRVEDNVWFGSEGSAKMKAAIVTYGFDVKSVRRLEGNCSK